MAAKFEIECNETNFQKEVIETSTKTPVVVDFYAEWCPPCRILKPLLEKLAHEYKGKFILAKVNTDENSSLATEYNIMSIPSVKFFKKGKVIDEFSGAIPEKNIRRWIDKNL